ncbi:fimbria/pilus outer membrane usher protein [Paraburkholderia sp. C35]|uniref:fimbria/pilus outer membrane usher protein n=1 Tax=Paraburkholderia sp. C35 TaxID=2126993 RepID=UPI001EF6B3D6|nr:fimbria/pilus outer membrane usher protein [Paraburkholderia sp. C35]
MPRASRARQFIVMTSLRHSNLPAFADTVTGPQRLRPVAALALHAFAIVAGLCADHAMAAGSTDAVEFDPMFLQSGSKVDVSRFARADMIAPGSYYVDVWINDIRIARENVTFVATTEGKSARACLTRAMLEKWGVDFSRLDPAKENAPAPAMDACIELGAIVPQATTDFDFGEQKLSITVPQKYMRGSARGYVPPELWTNGVNAGYLSYNANAWQSANDGTRTTQGYLGLNVGVNLGGWHFRHQSSVTSMTGQKTTFDEIATYAQHDVTRLRSQVVLGESNTRGDVFDTVAFRGAQIATDDRMLPESLRGYAPVVRGMAQSNARVSVRQNGQVIYETVVPPGPFEIRDLYPTGYGGNLDVTVTEADGREKYFTVPYASVAQLLRPGITRFAFTAGELRDDSLRTKPVFAQLTVQRGLTNIVTLYGGGIGATGYLAANAGIALNTPVGAFAGDITMASTQVPGRSAMRGSSLHISYSKFVDATDTNFAIGAYRYSSSNYLNLSDAARLRDYVSHGSVGSLADRTRGQFQLTISQGLARYGSVFISASSQDYWNRSGHDLYFQAGYSNDFRFGTYSVTLGRTENANGSPSNEVMVTTTIPLGKSRYAPLLSTTFNSGGDTSSLQNSLSGTAGTANEYAYNVYATANKASSESVRGSGGASGTYRGPYAQLTASASGSAHSSQVSAGVSGSIVAHGGGVTFSQPVGDTFGIVEAKGAQGANVPGTTNAKVDGNGYAIVPYLTPYSMNTVDIDPKGASMDVEFDSTSESAAPRLGSIVLFKYRTDTGRATLIRAPRASGEALPFGAEVQNEQGRSVAVVGQDSRIFTRDLHEKGTLTVKWGIGMSEQCRIDYALPAREEGGKTEIGYASLATHCTPVQQHTNESDVREPAK